MGKKDGELWDDSALIDAFEHAISSYKMMHGMKQIADGLMDGDVALEKIADEDVKSHVDKSTTSDADASSNSLAEATSPNTDRELNEDVSNGTLKLETVEGHLKAPPDYNSLVNQYYELQEKLQVVWQQLQLFGYDQGPQNTAEVGMSDSAAEVKEVTAISADATHADVITTLEKQNDDDAGRKLDPCQQLLPYGYPNNQCSDSAGVQGTYFTCQVQATTDSGSQPTAVCCVYPCTDKCMYSSGPANVCRLCTDAVPGQGPEKSLTLDDNDLMRVAMRAAEKAISSIKIQTADPQEGSGQISTHRKLENSEDNFGETDISNVLNAWFSAGLATGKYLAEQSKSRRRKG